MSKLYGNGAILLISLLILGSMAFSGCISSTSGTEDEFPSSQAEYRTVIDMRGVEVVVPTNPQRLIDISRGLVDEVMYIFGIDEIIVGGSFSQSPTAAGSYMWNGVDYTVNTMISQYLMPQLADAELVTNVGGFGGPYGGAPNVESILALAPDLMIIRDFGGDDENTMKFISLVEEAGVPVVVLKYPDCYETPSCETLYEEVRVLGAVFGQEAAAEDIVSSMKSRVDLIADRVSGAALEDTKRVLFFGAPTWAADKGGVGVAFGGSTIEVAFLKSVLQAESAYDGNGRDLVSAEQVLAMDPDVILLPTWSGYHAPRQLYDSAYDDISDLRAIQQGDVFALATTPVNSQRLEFPINLMISAKAIYPDLFDDIDIEEWTRDYFIELYDVDDAMCDALLDALMYEYLEIA